MTSTIYAGSSVLLLAHVQLGTEDSPSPRRSTHVRQKSDELMEDLEIQLGSSKITYMQIRVSYAHSAFPEHTRSDTMTGVSCISSRMETKATATLKRHNTLSPWSPRPAPSPNPLFSLIERHWGADKARDAMQQILGQRFTPRKPAQGEASLQSDVNSMINHLGTHPPPPAHPPPPIPVRHASLQKESFARKPTYGKGSTTDIRQRILSRGGSFETEADVGPFGNQSRGPPSARTEDTVPSEASDSISRGRSLGRGRGLKGLMPDFWDFTLDSRLMREKSFRGSITGPKRKKGSGKWVWASWF